MDNFKKDANKFLDKAEGEIKEKLGQLTGNQQLELEGKVKKKIVDTKEKIDDMKEDILKKINDKLDDSGK